MTPVSRPEITIIGAGLAGLACATALQSRGHRVFLLDKGRRPGGRMSTRSLPTPLGEAWFDYGAQFFTARDADFQTTVNRWIADGVAAPWPAAGDDAYVGVPAMSAPIQALGGNCDVTWSTHVTAVSQRADGWDVATADGRVRRADTLVVALPAEQTQALLSPAHPDFAARAAAVRTAPCWTLMAAFAERLPTDQDCWRGDPILGWAARNSAKPGRSGPESWVLQASPDWSRAHLEDDADTVAALLLQALSTCLVTALPPPIALSAHRWRYARSGSAGATLLWDPTRRLGICGDWLIGPRIEAAWMSGTALGAAIAADMERGTVMR